MLAQRSYFWQVRVSKARINFILPIPANSLLVPLASKTHRRKPAKKTENPANRTHNIIWLMIAHIMMPCHSYDDTQTKKRPANRKKCVQCVQMRLRGSGVLIYLPKKKSVVRTRTHKNQMKTCVRFTLICAWKGLTFAFEEGLLAKGNRKKCDKHNKIYKTFNFIFLNAFRDPSPPSRNLTLINHTTGGALEHDTHMIWRVCCSLLICDSGEPPSPNSGVVFILAQHRGLLP